MMAAETTVCNVCERPASFEDAIDVAMIQSNVRRFRHERFTVWRCVNCGSLHSREAVELDAYYADYPMRRQTRDFAAVQAFKNRLRFLRAQGMREGSSVLDYGCGTGLFVQFLRERGFDAEGYDPYVEAFSDPCILDRRFDFVISQDVIEHVDEPSELLRGLAGILKPGGTLVVGTPNASEISLDENFAMELHQPYHRHILSEQALFGLAENIGLKLVALQRRFYYDTPFPMVNTQFIKRYLEKAGGCLDAGFEKPRVVSVLTSPELLFYGIFGYAIRAPGNIVAVFRRA